MTVIKFNNVLRLTFLLITTILTNHTNLHAQCNTNTSICTPGQAGPFGFTAPGNQVSTCLDFIGPSYAYITLHITTGGPLELLIDGNTTTGFLDVAIFNIPTGIDPCVAIQDNANEIGCNYASAASGCNQFGASFGCPSWVPAPMVNAGDELMIVVENWSGASITFTMALGSGAQTGPPDATINPMPAMTTADPPSAMTAVNNGGTWTATCGACIDPNTGMFNPSLAGPGTHTICHDIGASPCDAQDCENVTVTSALAVEMESASVTCTDKTVQLDWRTMTETNCDYFLIERSRDTTNFEPVAHVNGHGTTTTPQDYHYQEPYEDARYYRITEVDLNKIPTVIGTYVVNCNHEDVLVYPNPGSDQVTISCDGFHPNQTIVDVHDVNNRFVKQISVTNGSGMLDVEDLRQGTYLLTVSDPFKRSVRKFTKL